MRDEEEEKKKKRVKVNEEKESSRVNSPVLAPIENNIQMETPKKVQEDKQPVKNILSLISKPPS